MKILFVMDPIETVNIHHDSSFALMLEARERGHQVYYTRAEWLEVRHDKASGRLYPIVVRPEKDAHFTLGHLEHLALEEMDVVFMRKDPPFDIHYVFYTYILDAVDPARTLVVNSPAGLRAANEKMYIHRFHDLIPDTWVTRDTVTIKRFLDGHGGEAILKPLDGMGGRGIFYLNQNDRNLNAIIEAVTNHNSRHVAVQQYLPAVREGDKRIILCDGEPLGAMLRIPRSDEHRANMAAGGSYKGVPMTDRDLEICAALAPHLKRDGLFFTGIDVIGTHLTEVNVTSPTGIHEINREHGLKLERIFIERLEHKVKALQR
ncbi:MAG: Glutathione synthetase [Myxococcota bacterium]|nr:Glutathione synthetase [Myxococcota bacterium]